MAEQGEAAGAEPGEAGRRVTFINIFRSANGGVAFGLMLLEFVTSVQTFVVSTVLPDVAAELNGGRLYGVAVPIAMLAVFVALPITARITDRYGTGDGRIWVGRFIQELSASALAVFGSVP